MITQKKNGMLQREGKSQQLFRILILPFISRIKEEKFCLAVEGEMEETKHIPSW